MKNETNQFEQIREAGRQHMAGRTVAICGLARDCAQNLEMMIPQVEELGSAFHSCRVIVVENDSTDRTGELLSSWEKRNHSIRVIQFSHVTGSAVSGGDSPQPDGKGWFGANRIHRIAYARNLYLDELAAQDLPDYVVVIDLDIRSFSLAGIEHSFGLVDEWDVITANGKRYSRRHPFRRSVYWDSYAFEPLCGFINGIQTPDQIRDCQTQIANSLKQDGLVKARSAFGGLGIYRAGLLAGTRYSLLKNDHSDVPVLCEHHALHRSINNRAGKLGLLINRHLSVDYGSMLQLAAHSIRTAISM